MNLKLNDNIILTINNYKDNTLIVLNNVCIRKLKKKVFSYA